MVEGIVKLEDKEYIDRGEDGAKYEVYRNRKNITSTVICLIRCKEEGE